jgi:hypothetical protein
MLSKVESRLSFPARFASLKKAPRGLIHGFAATRPTTNQGQYPPSVEMQGLPTATMLNAKSKGCEPHERALSKPT